MSTKSILACTTILAVALGAGCSERELRPLNPCTVSGVAEQVKVDNIENVDLLFMVDNSNSMSQEQASLSNEIPSLVRVLASGDIDDDGVQDFPPVRSLHVGVVSSDMGTGGFLVPTCSESNFGDDGVLRTSGNVARPGCMATYPSFLEFRPEDGGDPSAFANEVACVAAMGTNGCGFEQQLEAVLKAVTPSSSSILFHDGTVGHADVRNDGFLRDDSLLAVLLVTDEDDCSASDPELFNPSSTRYSGDLNLRCFQFQDVAVHPVERWVGGMMATRQDPDLLVFAAIAGIPEAVNPMAGVATDWEGILAHPDMQEMIDPAMTTRLRPSCDRPGTGFAFPPRRIVSAAQQLEAAGANAIVQTICQDSFTGAIQSIINKIADVLGGTCLPRSLNRDSSGLVNCDVVEVLPSEGEITRCDQVPGRVFLRNETDDLGLNHEVCEVTQLGLGEPGDGWFYESVDMPAPGSDIADRCPPERPQRIAFSRPPATGTTVRLECLQTVTGSDGMDLAIGSGCDPAADPCGALSDRADLRDTWTGGFACEEVSRTCQPTCTGTEQCAGGYVCADANPDDEFDATYCVNPTCAMN